LFPFTDFQRKENEKDSVQLSFDSSADYCFWICYYTVCILLLLLFWIEKKNISTSLQIPSCRVSPLVRSSKLRSKNKNTTRLSNFVIIQKKKNNKFVTPKTRELRFETRKDVSTFTKLPYYYHSNFEDNRKMYFHSFYIHLIRGYLKKKQTLWNK
jgi:hypothetical protein